MGLEMSLILRNIELAMYSSNPGELQAWVCNPLKV
jgi:hypothetical protein